MKYFYYLLVFCFGVVLGVFTKCNESQKSSEYIVNNCDSLQQVVNYYHGINIIRKMNGMNKPRDGLGVNLGYDYSSLMKKGGLKYGLSYRYDRYIIGLSYTRNLDLYSVRFGYQF